MELTNSRLIEGIDQISRLLVEDETVESTMSRVSAIAVHLLGGATEAGVSMVTAKGIETVGATSELVRDVDRIQYEESEGPCVDAIKDLCNYEMDDLGSDPRWPRFSRRAAKESPLGSLVAFLLWGREGSMGALNVYGAEAEAFSEEDRALGAAYAAHAAIALANAQTRARDIKEIAELRQALESRDVIGQAKGILMERGGMTADESFDLLRTTSQNLNIRLREIAGRVAAGELDLLPTSSPPGS